MYVNCTMARLVFCHDSFFHFFHKGLGRGKQKQKQPSSIDFIDFNSSTHLQNLLFVKLPRSGGWRLERWPFPIATSLWCGAGATDMS